jgi:hypothetical protein
MRHGSLLSDTATVSPAGAASAAFPGFVVSRWLFLRLLALVYLAAFLSLAVQVNGLIGSHGILPARDYLTAIRQVFGSERYYLAPTLCWLGSNDTVLYAMCIGGAVLACLLLVGLAPVPILFFLWVAYLSLTVVGQVFLGYQWDSLLLETGFLAIWLAPPSLWPRLGRQAPPPAVVLWSFRWLVFRLMFGSGAVKLLSGDPTWRSLTALSYHYETQPLPTRTSWTMHQLPGWFQGASVLATFGAELILPVLLFGPRRGRHIAVAGIIILQLLIAATGNYGFFNFLTIALCVPLLDDQVFPARWRNRIKSGAPVGRWKQVAQAVAVGLLFLTILPVLDTLALSGFLPAPVQTARQAVASFRLVNSYGLFAVMTTRRPEIIIEGSDDGQTWRAYECRWKPGNVDRRPAFTGLHMPRLDWQMWFAALGDVRRNPWLVHFLDRLLEGEPEVLALLEDNPFADRPPRLIRAVVFQYHFTDAATRAMTGAWWRREWLGLYCPVLTRSGGHLAPAAEMGQKPEK